MYHCLVVRPRMPLSLCYHIDCNSCDDDDDGADDDVDDDDDDGHLPANTDH